MRSDGHFETLLWSRRKHGLLSRAQDTHSSHPVGPVSLLAPHLDCHVLAFMHLRLVILDFWDVEVFGQNLGVSYWLGDLLPSHRPSLQNSPH